MTGISKICTAGRFCRGKLEGSQEAGARRVRAAAYGWSKSIFYSGKGFVVGKLKDLKKQVLAL